MVKNGEYSPLVTCGFVHGDFWHLLFNAVTLFFFGPVLEETIGKFHFLALYFIALVVSSLGTVIRQRRNPDYASLGASGAISGVLFAYIVYYPTSTIYYLRGSGARGVVRVRISRLHDVGLEELARSHQP